MKKIFSKKNPEKLLHIINYFNEINERTNVAPEEQYIQLATMKLNSGKTFSPHKHVWREQKNIKTIAQESWVVIQGSVCVHLYDLDDTHLCDEVIEKGDCSITFEGGHNYTIISDNTVVYEYKTGPYYGEKKDKTSIHCHKESSN